MAIDNESFNKQLYDLLKVRGYKPVPKNAKNQNVEASQLADVIEFNFIKDNEDYGKVWATIDDAQNVILYYDDDVADSPEGKTPELDYDDSWYGLLKQIKNWAQRRQLSFELKNKDRISDDMKQRVYVKDKARLEEGYHPMGKQSSYNDNIPTVKIILQHSRTLGENEQRYRNVARIFLENTLGERILAPTVRPGIAQIYARHLAEGGLVNDDRWNHIKGLVEDYTTIGGFVRATKNSKFNESAQSLVNTGVEHFMKLRETLTRMKGHRGYNSYFESYTPTLMEDEGNNESLNELFVQEKVDPRIENAMPILSRLYKNVTENTEIKALEEWAQTIVEGEDKDIDYSSLEVAGIDRKDSPDFSDAYFSNGSYKDGSPLPDDVLNQLTNNGDLLLKHIENSLHETTDLNNTNEIEEDIEDKLKFLKNRILPISSDKEVKNAVLDKISSLTSRVNEGLAQHITKDISNDEKLARLVSNIETLKAHEEEETNDKDSDITPHDVSRDKTALQREEEKLKDYLNKKYAKTNIDTNSIFDLLLSAIAGLSILSIAENLGPDQKAVGQVGPTEKAKKISPIIGAKEKDHPFSGRLVGAGESVSPDIARIKKLSGY
jgi:hypothetical protein